MLELETTDFVKRGKTPIEEQLAFYYGNYEADHSAEEEEEDE